jgi:hypothetical protein
MRYPRYAKPAKTRGTIRWLSWNCIAASLQESYAFRTGVLGATIVGVGDIVNSQPFNPRRNQA